MQAQAQAQERRCLLIEAPYFSMVLPAFTHATSVNSGWERATHIVCLFHPHGEVQEKLESACLLKHLTVLVKPEDHEDLLAWIKETLPDTCARKIVICDRFQWFSEHGEPTEPLLRSSLIAFPDTCFCHSEPIVNMARRLKDCGVKHMAVDLGARRMHTRHTIADLRRQLDTLDMSVLCVVNTFESHSVKMGDMGNFMSRFKVSLSHASTLGARYLLFNDAESRNISATKNKEYEAYQNGHVQFIAAFSKLAEFASRLEPPVTIVIEPVGNYLGTLEEVRVMVDHIQQPNLVACHAMSAGATLLDPDSIVFHPSFNVADHASFSAYLTAFLSCLRLELSTVSEVGDDGPDHEGNGDGDKGGDNHVDVQVAGEDALSNGDAIFGVQAGDASGVIEGQDAERDGDEHKPDDVERFTEPF